MNTINTQKQRLRFLAKKLFSWILNAMLSLPPSKVQFVSVAAKDRVTMISMSEAERPCSLSYVWWTIPIKGYMNCEINASSAIFPVQRVKYVYIY